MTVSVKNTAYIKRDKIYFEIHVWKAISQNVGVEFLAPL